MLGCLFRKALPERCWSTESRFEACVSREIFGRIRPRIISRWALNTKNRKETDENEKT